MQIAMLLQMGNKVIVAATASAIFGAAAALFTRSALLHYQRHAHRAILHSACADSPKKAVSKLQRRAHEQRDNPGAEQCARDDPLSCKSCGPACAPTPCKALPQQSPRVGLSKDPKATVKRDCFISWDDYFMSVAVLSSFRSKDPNRQVGACIISPETRRIIGIGYNGFPSGCSDDALPWARAAASPLDTKYPYVCHAEMNALREQEMNAILNKNCESLQGCRMYVTLFPCNECAKLIIQSRLAEVVYFSDRYHDSEMMEASRRMLQMAGVRSWQHKPVSSHVLIDFDEIN